MIHRKFGFNDTLRKIDPPEKTFILYAVIIFTVYIHTVSFRFINCMYCRCLWFRRSGPIVLPVVPVISNHRLGIEMSSNRDFDRYCRWILSYSAVCDQKIMWHMTNEWKLYTARSTGSQAAVMCYVRFVKQNKNETPSFTSFDSFVDHSNTEHWTKDLGITVQGWRRLCCGRASKMLDKTNPYY